MLEGASNGILAVQGKARFGVEKGSAMHDQSEATFGTLLRQWREATGLTQEQLAERAGLTAKAIGALERGERRHPYPHTVKALMEALGVSDHDRHRFAASLPRREPMPRPEPSVAAFSDHIPTLSPPPTTLIGRDKTLQAIETKLTDGETRLLTLIGAGGVGKTRLALAVAARLRERFPQGVAVVSLAPILHIQQVLPAIATAIGLRPAAGQDVLTLLQEYLRPRTMLVVLDNFEHLIEAATGVSALLATCPLITILVTSRAPLRIQGEQECPVTPLPVPTLTTIPSLEAIEAIPSITLFVQRARTVAPHFELTQANATAIAAICRRLDGLPLALELAAARIKLLTPMALLARLDQALPLLVGGARDLPERQQTMRQTIAWSHALLNENEKMVFRRLSVFAGGWTLEAAETVCGTGKVDVLEGLATLQNNSLVVRVEQATHPEPRFTMLETIRATHAAYMNTFVKQVAPFFEVKRHAHCLHEVTEEYNNIRAAVEWWREQGEWETIADIGWELRFFMGIRDYIREGQTWFEQVLAQGDRVSGYRRTRAWGALGLFMQQSGKPEAGLHCIEQARTTIEADPEMEMFCDLVQGLLFMQATRYNAADHYFEQVIRRTEGHPFEAANAIARIGKGHLALLAEAWESGESHLQTAISALRKHDSWWNLAYALNVYGNVAYFRGDILKAESRYREALELTHEFGDRWALVFAVEGLGRVRVAQEAWKIGALILARAEYAREQFSPEGYGTPAEISHVKQVVETLREKLGDVRFEQLWAEGRAMHLDDTVALALAPLS